MKVLTSFISTKLIEFHNITEWRKVDLASCARNSTCQNVCPDDENYVCGSNGGSYSWFKNICLLELRNCNSTGTSIGLFIRIEQKTIKINFQQLFKIILRLKLALLHHVFHDMENFLLCAGLSPNSTSFPLQFCIIPSQRPYIAKIDCSGQRSCPWRFCR